jgi:hypothetical protein
VFIFESGEVKIFNSSALGFPQSLCIGVIATDGGGLTTTQITLTVHTVADNTPSQSDDQTIYVHEKTPVVSFSRYFNN